MALFFVLLVLLLFGAVFVTFEHQRISRLLEQAKELSLDEEYPAALKKLETAQNGWLANIASAIKQNIANEIEKNTALLQEKLDYEQGIERFNKEDWQASLGLLSGISNSSSYYEPAQEKIEQAREKILEGQITKAVEQASREARQKEQSFQDKIAVLERKIKSLEEKQRAPASSLTIPEIIDGRGRYIVRVICLDKQGNSKMGSGILWGNEAGTGKSYILTNYHLLENAYWEPENNQNIALRYPCSVGYSVVPTKKITDWYLASPIDSLEDIPLPVMQMIDFILLRVEVKVRLSQKTLEEISGASLTVSEFSPQACAGSKIKAGEEIVVLGYPLIGGETLTASEGIISGFEKDYYLTTSAKIEQGGSGGGAFLKSTGCLAGMASFARLGKVESFARLISIPFLEENYLSKVFQVLY